MNTVTLTSSTYKGVENYARTHNLSMEDVVQKGLQLLITIYPSNVDKTKEMDKMKSAYSFIDTIPAKGGKPVPNDERGIDALIEKKYSL